MFFETRNIRQSRKFSSASFWSHLEQLSAQCSGAAWCHQEPARATRATGRERERGSFGFLHGGARIHSVFRGCHAVPPAAARATRDHKEPPRATRATRNDQELSKDICTVLSEQCSSGSLMEALESTQCPELPGATCCHQDAPGTIQRGTLPGAIRCHQEPPRSTRPTRERLEA